MEDQEVREIMNMEKEQKRDVENKWAMLLKYQGTFMTEYKQIDDEKIESCYVSGYEKDMHLQLHHHPLRVTATKENNTPSKSLQSSELTTCLNTSYNINNRAETFGAHYDNTNVNDCQSKQRQANLDIYNQSCMTPKENIEHEAKLTLKLPVQVQDEKCPYERSEIHVGSGSDKSKVWFSEEDINKNTQLLGGKDQHEIGGLWDLDLQKQDKDQPQMEKLRMEVIDSREIQFHWLPPGKPSLKGYDILLIDLDIEIESVKKRYQQKPNASHLEDAIKGTNIHPVPACFRSVDVYALEDSESSVRKEAREALQEIEDGNMNLVSVDETTDEENLHQRNETCLKEPLDQGVINRDVSHVVSSNEKDEFVKVNPLRELAASALLRFSSSQEICLAGQFIGEWWLSRRRAKEEGERNISLVRTADEQQGTIIVDECNRVVQKKKSEFINIHAVLSESGVVTPNPGQYACEETEAVEDEGVKDEGDEDQVQGKTPDSNNTDSKSPLLGYRVAENDVEERTTNVTDVAIYVRFPEMLHTLGSLVKVIVSELALSKGYTRPRGSKKRKGKRYRRRKRRRNTLRNLQASKVVVNGQLCQKKDASSQNVARSKMLSIIELACLNWAKKDDEEVFHPVAKKQPFSSGLPADFFKYYAAFVPKRQTIFLYPASLNDYFIRLAKGPAFLPGEENKYEAVRLASFRDWPQWAPVAATRLARSGFYYSGSGDEVVCFSCRGRLKDWTSQDNPVEQHKRNFPGCSYVRGSDNENVPLVPGPLTDNSTSAVDDSIDAVDPFPNLARSNSQGSHNNPVLANQQALQQSLGFNSQDNSIQSLASLGSTFSQLRGYAGGQPLDSMSHYQHLASAVGRDLDERDNDRNPSQTSGTFTPQSSLMKNEADRLRTYSLWPISAHVRPHDLAKAGFFYMGNADCVQCAFCRGILRNWDPGDRPMQEHRHHFPTCPFILGIDVGNIPVEPDHQNLPAAVQESIPILGRNTTGNTLGGNAIRGEDLGILTERPKHERFAVESVRLATYSHWSSHHTQEPEVLARAGFFYAGFADNVKCFFCDGGLRNWERGDDPWIEHARWFPRCGFVKQCKGEEFIRTVQETNPPQYPTNVPRPEIARPLPAQTPGSGSQLPGQFPVEPREIKARLDTPTVQAVLEMGCSRTTVRTAIEQRLRNTGDDFPNAESLLEAIFEIEENMNRARERGQPGTGGAAQMAQARGEQPRPPTSGTSDPQRSTGQSKKKTEDKKSKKKRDKKGDTPAAAPAAAPLATGDDDEEAKSLMEENQRLKEQRTCKICMDEDVSVVFLPCGHLVACTQCAPALRNCPICRATIRGTVRTYLS